MKFLKDQPLQSETELKKAQFGHQEIAQTLVKIITDCPTPFTVGLFGKWGAGKSTIANLVREDLLKSALPMVIFDVWKHEGDSLRRTFLREMVYQLGQYGDKVFDPNFKLDDRLEHSITNTDEGKFQINWQRVWQSATFLGIMAPILALTGVLLYQFVDSTIFWIFFAVLIATIFSQSFILQLLQFATQFLKTTTTTFSYEKLQDPHEFEREFIRVVNSSKSKRLLIIFDNLDRVVADKAVETLTILKTFLEPRSVLQCNKEIVFLIPCDAEAIKSHILRVYKVDGQSSAFDPAEFVRKFFNAVLFIPDFIPSELESYTMGILRYTEVSDLDDSKVAWIITKAFRENPRQIIQFVNILLANYLLVKMREGDNRDFPANFLPENVPQLTKYLILNQLFPEEMATLRATKFLNLQQINENEDLKDRKGFLSFCNETASDIPITDLRLFFTLRRSEQEKNFPGIETFITLLEDKKVDEASKYVKQITDLTERVDKFSQVIILELENKSNPVSAVSLIDSLFKVLEVSGIRLTNTAYGEIYNKLNGDAKKHLHTISPKHLNNQVLSNHQQYQKEIISQWVVVLEDQSLEKPRYNLSPEFVREVLEIAVGSPEYFDAKEKSKIANVLAKKYFSSIDLVELLFQPGAKQNDFINLDFVNNFITSINPTDIENKVAARKLALLEKFSSKVMSKEETLKAILQKMTELQAYENSKPPAVDRMPIKEGLFLNFRNVLFKIKFFMEKIKGNDAFGPLDEAVALGFNAIPSWDERKIAIPLLFVLEPLLPESRKAKINGFQNNFFTNSQAGSIDFVLQHIPTKYKYIEDGPYSSIFHQRALNDQTFFDHFYEKCSEEAKVKWLLSLLEQSPSRALDKIKSLKYVIPSEIDILKKLLEKENSAQAGEKFAYYDVFNKMKCGGNVTIKEAYLAKIEKGLTSTDSTLQKVGSDAILQADFAFDKRKLLKSVFDWIRKSEVSAKYQPYSLQIISSWSESFNEEEEKDYLQFIFDELIRKSGTPESMNFGFGALKKHQPAYEKRKANFDDIKSRIEIEQNAPLRKTLILGLRTLKPTETNENNLDFWQWVDKESTAP